MSVDCVVIVPMLGRPATVGPLTESLAASTTRARPLFVVTTGDTEVLDAVAAVGADHLLMAPRDRGDYAAKINHGVAESVEQLIFTGACDLAFMPRWLEAAESVLAGPVHVAGTDDMTNPRTAAGHSTHSLMTRAYAALPCIDGSPGPLYTGYLHEYVDDEFVGTAHARGAYRHVPSARVEHLHPDAGKAPWDASYRDQTRRMTADRPLFHSRRRMWM